LDPISALKDAPVINEITHILIENEHAIYELLQATYAKQSPGGNNSPSNSSESPQHRRTSFVPGRISSRDSAQNPPRPAWSNSTRPTTAEGSPPASSGHDSPRATMTATYPEPTHFLPATTEASPSVATTAGPSNANSGTLVGRRRNAGVMYNSADMAAILTSEGDKVTVSEFLALKERVQQLEAQLTQETQARLELEQKVKAALAKVDVTL